jgi:hypothetical protein
MEIPPTPARARIVVRFVNGAALERKRGLGWTAAMLRLER